MSEQSGAKTGVARNTMANWGGQLAMLASGFVLPRLLHETLGAAELGVWDIAWTARSTIAMSSLGMGSSSNHHAARYQATGEWELLNRTLSATLALVIYTTWLALLIAAGLALVMPWLMPLDPDLVGSAQVLIMAMGFAAAMKMVQVVYGGSLAGIGRFDLLNLVEIVGDILLISALFGVLLAGFGLKTMAVCLVAAEVFRWLGKRHFLYRLCPKLRLWPRWTDWELFREIAAYGSKTLADSIANLILNQAVPWLLLPFAGAPTVALYSRSRALIRFTTRFVMGYARVLVSKAGDLQGRQGQDQLGKLLIDGTRYSLYLALPVAIVLLTMGRPLLLVWMGQDYSDPRILWILVAGFLPYQVQRSSYHVLLGIGQHGRSSLASLVAAILSAALAALFIGYYRWGVIGAAAAIAIPTGLVNAFVIPYFACRAVHISLWQYWKRSFGRPIVDNLPFAALLVAARVLLPSRPILALAAGLAVASPVLVAVYWRSVLPLRFKQRLKGLISHAS